MVGNPPVRKIPYLCGMKKYYLKYYERFVLMVWGCVFFLFWGQFKPGLTVLHSFLLSACIFCLAYIPTTYLSKTLLKRAMEQRHVLKFALQFFFLSLLFAVMVPLILFLFYPLEQHTAFPDMSYFQPEIIRQDFFSSIFVTFVLNFGFCGLRFFEINLKLQDELSNTQMQMLQAQINPHFMFNVLNHVHVLMKKEPELADTLLLQYTDILRYQLYSGKTDKIMIGDEVQFLKNFVAVEAIRWKNKLDIHCRWKTENPCTEIPPFLFITFIENAFKHVSRSNAEKGYVKIDFTQENKTVHFEVENSNSDDAPLQNDDSGIGLANIKRRLDILFPNRHSLEIDCNNAFYSIRLTVNL
jgi:hypothetical protein